MASRACFAWFKIGSIHLRGSGVLTAPDSRLEAMTRPNHYGLTTKDGLNLLTDQ